MKRVIFLICALVATTFATAAADPARDAKKRPAPQIETFEWSSMSSRGRLGVMVMSITPELRKHFGAPDDRGILVARVEPGSDAAAAGLAVGDVLVEVGGTAVDSAGDVLSALAPIKQGDAVKLEVIRAGTSMSLSAKLSQPPPPRMDAARPRWFDDMMRDPSRWFPRGWFDDDDDTAAPAPRGGTRT